MSKKQLQNIVYYFLVFMIIALTGFLFFFRDNTLIYYVLFPLSTFFFVYKRTKISKKAVILILSVVFLLLAQSFIFNLPYRFVSTGFIRFVTYYFIVAVIGARFNKIFINIIFFLCCVSLFFYASINISDSVYQLLLHVSENIKPLSFEMSEAVTWTNPSHTLILYTVPLLYKIRNSGPFWEPGMFAVFINIAFAINVLKTQKLFERKNVIFLITSITTLSINSFVATFIILIYYCIAMKRNIYSLIFAAILPFVVVSIYNIPYIKGKIESDLETSNQPYSRFGAALVHFKLIRESPWVGYGLKGEEEQEKLLGIKAVTPNGLTNIIRYYGIPAAILFYILLYKSSQIVVSQENGRKIGAILLFVVLLTVAFSQDVTTRHFYYTLIFLSLADSYDKSTGSTDRLAG